MPPANVKRKRDGLSDRFELEETFLSSPNATALKSAVLRAVNRRTDEPVVLKYWEKTGSTVDADLRELWRDEMRQSERVRAFPHADEVVVEVLGFGETDDAFYLAMPSDLAPLEFAARFVRSDHWLRSLKDNGKALKKVCARFVELCREMGLLAKASLLSTAASSRRSTIETAISRRRRLNGGGRNWKRAWRGT